MTEVSVESTNPSTESISKLGRLLRELKIKYAYYIDDYLNKVELPVVSGIIRTLFQNGQSESLKTALNEDINIELPDIDIVLQDFQTKWDGFSDERKKKIYKTVVALEDNAFVSSDYDRTNQLKDLFPVDTIQLISPDDWEPIFSGLNDHLADDDKVLFIFDQDLSKAAHEDFKSGRIQGDHLILKVKESPLFEKAYCTLITHHIPSIPEELERRKSIVEKHEGKLSERDFFALAKIRIENPELFCDGIKKAFLNQYCEFIKEKSKEVIENAVKNLFEHIDQFDTYDFDHTILRSSYDEGVWEVSTFFRITKTLFGHELNKEMVDLKYPLTVNEQIKKAKALSDIRFKIRPSDNPYQAKYGLRHLDIYENGDVINNLYMPIENGDIFQVVEGDGIGSFYILIAQECDLMVRSDGMRNNIDNRPVLLKIGVYDVEKFSKEVNQYVKTKLERRQVPHYFASKFRLDYFVDKSDSVGIVDFNKPVHADPDVLDLVAFDRDGLTKIDILDKLDLRLLSQACEKRYTSLHGKYRELATRIEDIESRTSSLRTGLREEIVSKYYPKISSENYLGARIPYGKGAFNFGFKRVLRLRNPGASMLLDKYYKHLSRSAEPHDFAAEPK